MFRFYVVSNPAGLVAVSDSPDDAEFFAMTEAITNSTHSVHLHDRLTEIGN